MFIRFTNEPENIYYNYGYVEQVKKDYYDLHVANLMLIVRVGSKEYNNKEMIAVEESNDYESVEIDFPPNSYSEMKTMIEYSFDIASFDIAKPKWHINYTSSTTTKKRKSSSDDSDFVGTSSKKFIITKICNIYKDGFLCECKNIEGVRHFKADKITNMGLVFE